MMCFNNTSKLKPYTSPDGQMVGVVLPRSEKVLSEKEIETKIDSLKGQINDLNQRLPHRNTHGGARFRAKQTSIKNRITSCKSEIKLLNEAKKVVVELKLEQLTAEGRFIINENVSLHRQGIHYPDRLKHLLRNDYPHGYFPHYSPDISTYVLNGGNEQDIFDGLAYVKKGFGGGTVCVLDKLKDAEKFLGPHPLHKSGVKSESDATDVSDKSFVLEEVD